jgi:CHAD domain-containing protein
MAPSDSPAKRSASKSRRGRLHGAMTCEAAFRRIALGCLGEVAACHQATCAGTPAALHQMRIALTRLRAAVAFFSQMVADAEWTRLKSELKWLSGYLGATRDLDVAIEALQRTGRITVLRAFRTARTESLRRLQRVLGSDRYRRWFAAMSEWVEHGPWSAGTDPRSARRRATPTSIYHAHKLARWHEKLTKKSRGLQGMGKRKLHRLRIASKRLRYAIEFSEGVLAEADFARWQAVVKQLRKGQKILGELNDAEIRWSLIGDLERSTGRTLAPDRGQMKQLDRKRAGRLLRRAAIVYHKIAGSAAPS